MPFYDDSLEFTLDIAKSRLLQEEERKDIGFPNYKTESARFNSKT